jgi:hypothetical protein
MPHISEFKDSRFLKKEDCGVGILVTIRTCEQINVAKEGAPQELKWCLSFDEVEKPMVVNSTNAQIIAQITGAEDTENWTGHKIVLYSDPNISFGGKLVGGIRARAPRNQPAKPAQPTHGILGKPVQRPAPAPAPQEEPLPSEDIDSVPF